MAYTPISNSTKSGGGYIPIGSSKKTYTPKTQVSRPNIGAPTTTKTPFAATKTGVAVNTALGIPKAIGGVLQGIARGSAASASLPAVAVSPLISAAQGQGFKFKAPKFETKGSKAGRIFFGGEDISVEKEGSEVAQLFGASPETAQKYGLPIGVALSAFDFVGGPGKKNLFKEATIAAKDIKSARTVLKNAGVTDDVISTLKLDSKVVKAKSASDVAKISDEITRASKASKEIAKTTPLKGILAKADTPVVKSPTAAYVPISRKAVDVTPTPKKSFIPKRVPESVIKPSVVDEVLAPSVKATEKIVADALEKYIFFNNPTKITPEVVSKLDDLKIKSSKPVTLYREGVVDNTKLQSWSKEPTNLKNPVKQTFEPEQVLVDTTDPRLVNIFPETSRRSLKDYNGLEQEVIIKPLSTQKLPTLPKPVSYTHLTLPTKRIV